MKSVIGGLTTTKWGSADSLRDGTKGFGTCPKTLTAGEKAGLLTHQLLSHTDCGSILES